MVGRKAWVAERVRVRFAVLNGPVLSSVSSLDLVVGRLFLMARRRIAPPRLHPTVR